MRRRGVAAVVAIMTIGIGIGVAGFKPAGAATTTSLLEACAAPAKRVVPVTDASTLQAALNTAQPGDRIELGAGVYSGQFVINRSGTSTDRIRLCGSRAAILSHGVVTTGRGIHMQSASFWDLSGFTVTMVKKGIVVDAGTYNVISNIEVHAIGEEAIHLRSHSTDNTITGSSIHHTGLTNPSFGEGVYVGSPFTQWCTWSACGPDRSDRNVVSDNAFSFTTAEPIDVKEGTRFGRIEGNSFDGTGLLARSWVDVKGNNWSIRNNTGSVSPVHGFMTETAVPGWGTNNTFIGNVANVFGTGWGYSMRPGNVVGCDNVEVGAAQGLSNIPCTAL